MRRTARRSDHASETVTDVRTYRVRAASGDGYAAIGWDYPGATLLQVRVLRSERGFASAPDAGGLDPSGRDASAPDAGMPDAGAPHAAGQTVVYDGVTGSFRDDGLPNGRAYFYTVFARPTEEAGGWVRWAEYRLVPGEPATVAPGAGMRLRRAAGVLPAALGRLTRRALPAAALIVCAAAVAIGAGAALAADEPAEGDGNGAGEAAEPLPEWAARAVDIAQADPRVAAVLAGLEWEPAVTPWGGAALVGAASPEGDEAGDEANGESLAPPVGAAVVFTWPAAQARDVGAEWPLVRSLDGDEPAPPFEIVEHRLRLETLSALQVDVLLQDGRVLQLLPLDGETRFDLREETWPPFSWVPFFTERPWLPAPFLVALAVAVTAAAWRRSRAWNRRSPSMTRHDRQFIGRLAVVVFMLGGLAWQVYEGYRAATYPAIDTGGVNAGELVALPMLLLPPALFVAGIALELSSGSHRVAWGLLAVLCAAGSAYNLAIALTGTVTNLNLSAYLLLAVLAILAVPRAFSSGKMGWSRSATPAVY